MPRWTRRIEFGFTWLADGDTAKIEAFVRTVLDVAGHDGLDPLQP
jgi:hypothetical protein